MLWGRGWLAGRGGAKPTPSFGWLVGHPLPKGGGAAIPQTPIVFLVCFFFKKKI
jgi:hypothetical protein